MASPQQMRNIILLSHPGAGKTSLVEALLFTSGVTNRLGRVTEGNTVSDFDPDETRRQSSINLSLLPLPWREHHLNLIDTPGYADFLGEVLAGLRVVEAAILVVDATSGVEVGTEQMWDYLEKAHLPRLIFINKMDRENANFQRTLKELQARFSPKCLPVQHPLGAQADFRGVIDLVSNLAYLGSEGEPKPPPEEAEKEREKLIETAVETNDELIARYLEGGEITEAEIRRELKEGVKSGRLIPVLAGSALQNIGIFPLLDAVLHYLPSPQETPPVKATNTVTGQEVELTPSSPSPVAALVFKTMADPYVGKLSYFRVFSGVLTSNSLSWNARANSTERIGQLFSVRGKTQEAVTEVRAGDIGAVARLSVTIGGDLLSSREHPLTMPPKSWPSPILSLALHPKSKADLDKMGLVLPRLLEEDPTLQIRREHDTGEILLAGMGEAHLEVAAERLRHKFGVEVRLEVPQVPYKETISIPVKTEYRHKKQTGGHGQFAHVFLEMEPLPRNSGIQFEDKIVGMAISRNFIPSVERGVREAAQEGVLAGYPVIDVRASLYNGKEHPVDSNDICFKIAGAHAFKQGLEQARPLILEPIMKLQVTVPESLTGDIISDLNAKRGKVLGLNPDAGKNTIEALAPSAEVQHYGIDLRALTQGRGSFSLEFSHYEEVPPHQAQRIIAQRKAQKNPG